MRLDLDELERQARAAMDGDPDSWSPSHRQTLALIARIRELSTFVYATPDAALQADKVYCCDFAELFTDQDGNALYMDEAKRRILDRGAVLP